jgi:hypothetical protein
MDSVFVGPEDFALSHDMVHEFVFLNALRFQLRERLTAYHLPTDLTDDDARWNQFVTYYAGVIEDGTLSCSAAGRVLKHVKQVTFTKGRGAVGEFSHMPFNMVWRVALLNGKTLDVDVNARTVERGSPMVAWGLHLN